MLPHRLPGPTASATLLLLAVVLLALPACGDDDGGSNATATPAESATASGSTLSPTPGALPANAVDLATADTRFVLETPDESDIQVSLASLSSGDFNGDGSVDLAVGAATADGPNNERPDGGEVYVIFDAEELSGDVVLSEDLGAIIYGAGEGDYAGYTVAAADVNGDGTDDLLVTAPGTTAGADPRTDQGRVYALFGSPEFGGETDLGDESSFNFVLTGAEGFSRAGHALATGDVNDDGTDDIVIGAPYAGREPGSPPGSPRTGAGALYVVYGSADLSGEVNVAFEAPDFVVSNQEQFSQFAAAVAVGDVNGDGVADMTAGAPLIDAAGRPAAGAVYVFYGSQSLAAQTSSDQADIIIEGAEESDAFGVAVAVADFDGDGRADVAASAPQADGPDNDREVGGEVYVFSDLASPGVIDLASSEASAVVYGRQLIVGLGQELASGMLDGDDLPDLVASGPLATVLDDSRPAAGETVIVYGSGLEGTVDSAEGDGVLAIEGPEQNAQSGAALLVAPIGEGGSPLLIIGAARSTQSDPRSGLFYGLTPTQR